MEEQLIEEEVARRVKEQIEERVKAAMGSDAVQQSLQTRLEAERKVLEEQVMSLELFINNYSTVTSCDSCLVIKIVIQHSVQF